MAIMRLNKDGSEIISYDEAGIPIYIREGYLSFYPEYRALCHWHEDLEFIYVLEGEMDYYINGESITLTAGSAVMINAGRLHYGYSLTRTECHFYCIILHPSLLAGNKKLYEKYIAPVTEDAELDYLLFDVKSGASEILQEIFWLKKDGGDSYELEVVSRFHRLWKIILGSVGEGGSFNPKENMDADLTAQRQMVSYIYQNFASNLSLEEIASAGRVCRSKCCQIFKKYVGQSPMDFVNSYRLECSQHLLQTTNMKITEICTTCGFNHLSYFSKQFHLKYGSTPREYRKKHGQGEEV